MPCFVQENLRKMTSGVPYWSGVPYSSPPISAQHTIDTTSASDVDDASRLSWKQADDVTPGDQSAADVDTLIGRYASRPTTGNLPVGTEPRSDEVQRLIKVRKSQNTYDFCFGKRSHIFFLHFPRFFLSILRAVRKPGILTDGEQNH